MTKLNKNLKSCTLNPSATINEAINNLQKSGKKIIFVINKNKKLAGIITDGDIRRMLKNTMDIASLTAQDIMGMNPKTISKDAMAIEALETLENNNISQILVTDNKKNYVGVVHLHDLIKEGIF